MHESKSVTGPRHDQGMEATHVDEAVELLEKANADLEPELLSVPEARERLEAYETGRVGS